MRKRIKRRAGGLTFGMRLAVCLVLLAVSACSQSTSLTPATDSAKNPYESEHYTLDVHIVIQGLATPWSIAFLPGGSPDAIEALVTERGGQLRRIRAGRLEPNPIEGVPEVAAIGQGGLLDIALAPDFETSGEVFLTFSEPDTAGARTALLRARYDGHALREVTRIAGVDRASDSGVHFGSRIAFDTEGRLLFSAGDRGERERAQRLDDLAGSILRVDRDGAAPTNNPFTGDPTLPGILYSYGHRNPQGLTRHPTTGQIWAHEHAPRGGDEVNVVLPGRNYGWPVITYGREYATFQPVGEGTERDDVEPPRHVWIPSIAPSGMTFYTGALFPAWQGNLFVGSLKFGMVARLSVNQHGQVVGEERLLEGALPRIRDVRVGPGDFLYLLTDEANGKLLRIGPG